MKKYILLILFTFLSIASQAQSTFGYIKEKATGESIPNAVITDGSRYVVSNAYGYYSIDASSSIINVNAYGFSTAKKNASEAVNGRLDFFLEPLHSDIDEVTVKSKSLFQAELNMPRMSRHSISAADIKSTAVLFGEPDAIKILQNLPGVNSGADGSVNLSVRGSSHDQNMIIIDEATVYNPSHALGIFSGFNPDAISNVEFYKSGYSPKYGGKIAAVVDIRMKEGSNQQFHLDGGIGNVVSKLVIETPVVKNVGSLMLAGRYGNGALVNTIAEHLFYEGGSDHDIVKFYDFCAKTNWNLSASDRLFASGYMSHDKFRCDILLQDNNQEWGNQTATLRWNHIFSDRLFSNFTATASRYDYFQQQEKDVRDFKWTAGQSEVTLKADFDHYLGNLHLTYGADLEKHWYNPGQVDPLNAHSAMLPHHLTKKDMTLGALYINGEIKFSDRFNASLGARLSSAYNAKRYTRVEPRAALSLSLGDNTAIKASYAHTAQFDHMLTNSVLSMPTDIWMPVSKIVAPETANTFSAGIHSALADGAVELFCEGYYKRMDNTIDYRDNANLSMNEDVDLEVKKGEGRAYGVETMAKYEKRAFKAQISYTISLSERRSDEINSGNWYYAAYDQRHNLSATTTIRGKKNEVSFVFKYHTGGRATVPYTTFSYDGVALAQYTERNGYVLPVFHRLDFSWRHNFPDHGRYHSHILFSLYNCYGRKNAYSVFVKGNEYSMSVADGYMMYLYRWMPSISYCFNL
ncbi:MAG: TonB-dependent receptor plug domain-containing protein [Bacteroidales bacterium]|nr:TonB-dependent receptor plug domain-containing protein [Bacteroidales bacterium]